MPKPSPCDRRSFLLGAAAFVVSACGDPTVKVHSRTATVACGMCRRGMKSDAGCFWAIDIGEHPTVADNFQYGYQMAGNFIAAQSEQEAMALLLYRLIEPEVDRKGDQRF